MKLVLEKLDAAPKEFLANEFVKCTNATQSGTEWFTFTSKCIWDISKTPPIKLFRAFAVTYIDKILGQLSAAYLKTNNELVLNHITSLEALKSTVQQSSTFSSDALQIIADIDSVDNSVLWAFFDRPLLTGTSDNCIYKVHEKKFVRDPSEAKDMHVSKRSGLHSSASELMPWSDIPQSISIALGYAMLTGFVPKTPTKSKAMIQIAGAHAWPFVHWFMGNVARDYGCKVNSINQIPKDRASIRVIFFGLNSTAVHVPTVMYQLKKLDLCQLVVLVTSCDLTCLPEVSGYYVPRQSELPQPTLVPSVPLMPLTPLNETPGSLVQASQTTPAHPTQPTQAVAGDASLCTPKTTLEFLVNGYNLYYINNCIPALAPLTAPQLPAPQLPAAQSLQSLPAQAPPLTVAPGSDPCHWQLEEILEEFLQEHHLQPIDVPRGRKANRMRTAELADIIRNRALKKQYLLLAVHQKDLVRSLRAKGFKLVRPRGTTFFKYRTAS